LFICEYDFFVALLFPRCNIYYDSYLIYLYIIRLSVLLWITDYAW